MLGFGRVRRYFLEALRELKDWGGRKMAGAPTLLGEFGLPFDLDGAKAYRSGDYRVSEGPLRLLRRGGRQSPRHSTIWNYAAGNRHGRGDLWNTEDLSIFCRDDLEAGRTETGDGEDSGGRALRGFVRPYARATAGEILEMRFDARRGRFLFRYRPDPSIAAPTEIFVPEPPVPPRLRHSGRGMRSRGPPRSPAAAREGRGREARLALSRR